MFIRKPNESNWIYLIHLLLLTMREDSNKRSESSNSDQRVNNDILNNNAKHYSKDWNQYK